MRLLSSSTVMTLVVCTCLWGCDAGNDNAGAGSDAAQTPPAEVTKVVVVKTGPRKTSLLGDSGDPGVLPDCCKVDADGNVVPEDAPGVAKKSTQGKIDMATKVTTPQDLTASAPVIAGDLPAADLGEAGKWQTLDKRGEFFMDFRTTDQDGKKQTLDAYVGKPIAMAFMYTNCDNAKMCPMTVVNMANLQRMAAKENIGDQVQFILMRYDPKRDTPARLKKYGLDRGIRFDNAVMLRPAMDDFAELLDEFAITLMPYTNGSIGHGVELLLIDKQGRFVRDYSNGHWKNSLVVQDLKKLVGEESQTNDTPEPAPAPADKKSTSVNDKATQSPS